MNKFYITTAIAYVNAPPHVGHALEFIQADAIARYHKLKGDDTYYLTGTDEHGVKVFQTAQEKGVATQEFVDGNAKKFKDLDEVLHVKYDGFVRTSSEAHKAACQKLWRKLVEAGDIYKGVYKGNYCVGCEAFIAEKDLDEEGNCPNHKKKPDVLEEENYFFKLSKYSDKIREAIESGELAVVPESRKNEILNIIGEGLKDVSFSRPKSVLPWGVDVPDDPEQVMYVWCDALSNYITYIGYGDESDLFKKFWPADVHLIGKDILRFHAGVWIGMLMSAGLSLPKTVLVHGFITSEGQKMSKSLGNVVDPLEYVEKYGVDAVRYYLLREIPSDDDGDFSHKRFLEVFNSELANSLGNLVNRVVMMTGRYVDGGVPEPTSGDEISSEIDAFFDRYCECFEKFDIKGACETIVALTDFGNKYVDDKKPWILAKDEPDQLPAVLYNLLEILRCIATLMFPILPSSAGKIASQIGLNVSDLSLKKEWGVLKKGAKINTAEVLFPRIEEN